ncbi:DNA-binding domain-containing protein [Dyella sedimenti]|uniref:HvfC/BufC N-terminal domain-containing protein n=1 Tax=Dyella sedimenti TaxID=2919947 RepID=UPI001FAA2917|nr:DNA-binding domain-containing protein [Dyella sedimenti]
MPRASHAGPRRLDERQREFAAALLDPGLPVPAGIVDPEGKPSAKRFAVYRNNVAAGLIDALGAAFPAVRRIVGDTFFPAMARIYAARHPPRSPVMLGYGETFAGFIGAFEPAAGVPYLADVARMEWAWLASYHAAEASPLDPALLAGMPRDRLPALRLALHPSLRVVRSAFPVVSLWRMNIDGGTVRAIDTGEGEDALVVRPDAEVEVRIVPRGAALFIQGLAAGMPVASAAAGALDEDAKTDLAGTLSGLLALDAIVGLSPDPAPDSP